MGKPGRKRKEMVARYPSGQIKRPSRAEMEEIERKKRDGEKHVVLMQPHRKGETSQLAGSAFGRFCLRVRANPRLYDAGQEYAALVRRWRSAKGIPQQVRLGEGRGGEGPSDATVMAWTRAINGLNRAMSKATIEGYLAMRQMLLDDYDIGAEQEGPACDALIALAVDLGFAKESDHPFRGVQS